MRGSATGSDGGSPIISDVGYGWKEEIFRCSLSESKPLLVTWDVEGRQIHILIAVEPVHLPRSRPSKVSTLLVGSFNDPTARIDVVGLLKPYLQSRGEGQTLDSLEQQSCSRAMSRTAGRAVAGVKRQNEGRALLAKRFFPRAARREKREGLQAQAIR